MKRRLWRIATALAVLLIVIAVSAVFVLRSGWFHDYVRQRIIEEAQRATGAKVEIGMFSFDWQTLRAKVDNLVLRGKEPAEEAPLLRVNTATLGLRIISVFERQVDLRSLRVEAPQVRVIVYEDGTTNIPGPNARPEKLWTEDLLNLKVGEYEIVNGTLEYDNRRTPINVQGKNLNLQMTYNAGGPDYRGRLSSEAIHVVPPGYDPVDLSVDTDFVLEANRVRWGRLHVASGGVSADIGGTLDDLRAPHGTVTVRANAPVRDIVREFRLPVDPSGNISFNGNVDVAFAETFTYTARGQVAAQGLRFVQDKVKIENASVRGNTTITATGASLRQFTAQALGATFTGDAELRNWKTYQVKGNVQGVNLRQAAAMATERPVPWNGVLSGTFEASGTLQQPNLVARTSLGIVPATDGEPISGHVDATYDQAQKTIALGTSSIETGATRVEVEGTLGRTLRVRARTTRLEDLNPVLAFVDADSQPGELPLKLNNGSIAVDGTVTGALEDPHFRGQATIANGEVRGYTFDRFAAELEASKREIVARDLTVARGRTTVDGSATVTADAAGTFENPAVAAQLTLRNVDVAEAAKLAGLTEPVTGTATATVRVSGTLEQPDATIALDVQNPTGMGEKADRLRMNVRYSTGTLELNDGVLTDAGTEVRFAGTYRHPGSDWRTGDVGFQVSTQNFPLVRLERMAALQTNVASVVSGRVEGTGTVRNGTFALTSATANASARQIVVDGETIGEATLTAQTRGSDLTVTANGNVRESRVEANGAWKLEGDAPGSATIRFSRISIQSLQDLVMRGQRVDPPSVEGFIEGDASINVALQRPRDFRAEVRLSNVQATPRENPAPRLGLTPEDVILRSNGPVVLEVTADGATVRSGRFTGRNTQMEVAGRLPFTEQGGADLTVRGNVDLIILQLLRPDLQANGNANVNVSVRGSIRDPNVNGQLSFTGAQLYLGDLPNGVDNAAGTILFDRRRATIQQLTAETGGGTITFTGFVEFGQTLVYRMQARARRVRVRYPQDVSTTFDADLSLNGTSQSSTLAGSVALSRTAFTFSADLGALLAEASQPAPAVNLENEYLSGMQLDVRISNGPNFQVESSLSSDVEADVDLRLRGTPSRPVLLGNVNINRGLVQLFGNRYTLERGDIRFLNPVKIEPTIDVELSTRARGITVNISLSGTPDKINPNYSSDPPLQSSEIVALLAVGRDPNTGLGQTNPAVVSRGSSMVIGAGSNLVGQALSAQMSNQAQRFFGAARVKIDPTLTGIDNTVQARLTWEQQVSKDITLTYITNLNRTQEQLVRVQWDLSRDWSAIIVRDVSGLFGVDFQYRKRFK